MKKRNLEEFGISGPKQGRFIIILISKWCKSCKLLSPFLEKYRQQNYLEFREIEIGTKSKLISELKITAVPALLFFNNGKLLNKSLEINGEMVVKDGIMIGSFNSELLEEIIHKIYS
ncbi:MAG: hypothetical protein GF317_22965 [Candidatus Lokiarchaeota archaeon]|nr:hypothetical protein [Candidatus Lokiarchaeota archaeon]MBD3202308.1 hypothetical protein [Candidatus Lokiarchaeota archaeon]